MLQHIPLWVRGDCCDWIYKLNVEYILPELGGRGHFKELVFKGYRASIGEDETILEMDDGKSYTATVLNVTELVS